MNNYQYYSRSLAYDFDMFTSSAAPSPKEKETVITRHPSVSYKKLNRSREEVRTKIGAIAIAVFIVAMVVANVFTRAEITKVDAQMAVMSEEINRLESEATRINCEIEKMTSYKNVEQSAKELGMNKTEKNQVVYIKTNADEINTANAE